MVFPIDRTGVLLSPSEPIRPSPRVKWRKTRRKLGEAGIGALLWACAASSILITFGIAATLIFESLPFFQHVSLVEFFTETMWTPLFAEPRYGILALVSGTTMTSFVALAVAIPLGTISAIYLSEFAPFWLRELLKPALELLSAVPTVAYR